MQDRMPDISRRDSGQVATTRETTMRALVLSGPGVAEVEAVPAPEPGPGQLVVAIERVGVCGTDAEFFRGTQPYLATGAARYPLRIGHEWSGRVIRVGEGTAADWLGERVSGDTMLGCQKCVMCHRGRQHLCPNRFEIGVLGGWAGALADELLVPAFAVHRLPPPIDAAAGALVEPASLALRAVSTLALPAGERLLVWGTGAIGLLAVAMAAAQGIEVHAVGRRPAALEAAEALGARSMWLEDEVRSGRVADFEGAIAASPDPKVPESCRKALRPGGHLVLVGVSGSPSPLDSLDLVVNDLRVTGLLSGSTHFQSVIDLFIDPAFDLPMVTNTLIGAVVGLTDIAAVLGRQTPADRAGGPKTQVDLSLT